jgi:phosphoserine phosphatase RsbU/P
MNGPLQNSVCRATIARTYEDPEEPALIIEDLAAVPDFAELPVTRDRNGIRLCRLPVVRAGGHPVGSFCILTVGRR